MTGFDLETTFLGLDGKGGVAELPVGPDFWETLGDHPKAFDTLVGIHPVTRDWPNWEVHPNGAEVLVLLDGRMDLIVDEGGAERRVEMRPGTTFVVPAGVWHTAKVLEPGRLLGMTFGAGTQHRQVQP